MIYITKIMKKIKRKYGKKRLLSILKRYKVEFGQKLT
jgi:hypothetical protein